MVTKNKFFTFPARLIPSGSRSIFVYPSCIAEQTSNIGYGLV